jgi:hypothetical protein
VGGVSAQLVKLIFEKALKDVFFQDMYANVCMQLAPRAEKWREAFMTVRAKGRCG